MPPNLPKSSHFLSTLYYPFHIPTVGNGVSPHKLIHVVTLGILWVDAKLPELNHMTV